MRLPEKATPGESGQAVAEQRAADTAIVSDTGAACLDKRLATAVARLALRGVEVVPVVGAVWTLRHARGAEIGAVVGLDALEAAAAGFEAVVADVAALVRRLGAAS